MWGKMPMIFFINTGCSWYISIQHLCTTFFHIAFGASLFLPVTQSRHRVRYSFWDNWEHFSVSLCVGAEGIQTLFTCELLYSELIMNDSFYVICYITIWYFQSFLAFRQNKLLSRVIDSLTQKGCVGWSWFSMNWLYSLRNYTCAYHSLMWSYSQRK